LIVPLYREKARPGYHAMTKDGVESTLKRGVRAGE
jgi:hypothetical protein